MKKNLKIGIATCFATALTVFGVGMAVANPVSASADAVTAESVGFTMVEGASVRIGTTAVDRGIRFATAMDKTEYNALMSQVGEDKAYRSISFGMVVTLAENVTDESELTVANLFGDSAKFDWNDGSENWEQTANTKLVVHYEFARLGVAEKFENDYVAFASLTNIKDANLTKEFIGRAYMKYTDAQGTTAYRMADYYEDLRANNARSIAYVAQKAIEDPDMSAHKDTLTTAYITHSAVAAQTTTVTVNHRKVDVYGKESVQTETLTEQTIGGTATATALTDEAWIYNEEKSTDSGLVYANGRTTLDLYYDQDPAKAFDLWYVNDGKEAIKQTYALKTPVTDGWYGDGVEVVLQIDTIDGTAPTELLFEIQNSSKTVIANSQSVAGHAAGWVKLVNHAVAGSSNLYSFTTKFPWAGGDWAIHHLLVNMAKGTYSVGVTVKEIKIVDLSDTYGTVIRGYGWGANDNGNGKGSNKGFVTMNPPVTGGTKGGSFTVTFDVTVLTGSITKMYYSLQYKNGTTVQALYNGAWDTKVTASGEYTYTATFVSSWAYTNPTDVHQVEVRVYGSSYYRVGVNVKSIVVG